MVALIGIDCATQPSRTGLALGRWAPRQGARLLALAQPASPEAIVELVAEWLAREPAALIALDAPLGWPAALGAALHRHRAGEALPGAARALFRRETDTFVHRQTGKMPLDVGADRIARTAHWALELLSRLRRVVGRPIPLAWSQGPVPGIHAIEVYPAGTLRVREWPDRGYKLAAQRPVREHILSRLGHELGLEVDGGALLDCADLLDAALCVLAGADFLDGHAMPPEDLGLAQREGWIWVRRPPPARKAGDGAGARRPPET